MEIYNTFDEAYRATLYDLKSTGAVVPAVVDPYSVGSRFGKKARATREHLSYGFGLADPRARLVKSSHRRFDLVFAVAQLVWFLSGSDSVEAISFYNPRGRDFSDDGRTVRGAYGKRLFNLVGGLNQMADAITKLNADPASRRVVALIYLPEDTGASSRDIPCTIGVQFLVREGALHMITNMRSQSAAFVMPYDVFAFTMLQEIVARELDLELGAYYHHSNSFHYYDDETAMVEAVLSEILPLATPMRSMPSGTSLHYLQSVTAFDASIRATTQAGDFTLDHFLASAHDFDPYWSQICLILLSKAVQGTDNYDRIIEQLWPEYQEILSHRATVVSG